MKKNVVLLAFLFLLLSQYIFLSIVTSAASPDDWPMVRHDAANTGSSQASWAPFTNQTLWNVSIGDELFSSPAISNGRVFVGAWSLKELTWCWHPLTVPANPNFYCFNQTTGAMIWKRSSVGFIDSSPACYDGKVYFGSENGNIYCLDAKTGREQWSYPAGRSVTGSPTISGGNLFIFSNERTYCLNASSGALQWSYPAGNNAVGASTAVVNDRVYLCSSDNKTYCLNADTGEFLWSYQTNGTVASSPAVVDGSVYFGSHVFYCLDAQSGALKWTYTASAGFGHGPAVANGKLFVGCVDNNLYCLDTHTGKRIWNYTVSDFFFSFPRSGRRQSIHYIA